MLDAGLTYGLLSDNVLGRRCVRAGGLLVLHRGSSRVPSLGRLLRGREPRETEHLEDEDKVED